MIDKNIKNNNFTISVMEVPNINKKLKSKSTKFIYKDEVCKNSVYYKFAIAILIKYILKGYQYPIEIAGLKDTKEHNIRKGKTLLQRKIDIINLTKL